MDDIDFDEMWIGPPQDDGSREIRIRRISDNRAYDACSRARVSVDKDGIVLKIVGSTTWTDLGSREMLPRLKLGN